ncbi:hypothetical protein TSTA_007500 [Talaromyces stipitatus ATCC 10500]|uniref:Uncharacterized protein n=1 Tax=Talaromyces stipitatus (strain ATCC 10500 / CBS 375.48 / QM 6759 / NRRL 1006) TaxID=441959 RepID=B8MVF1_TALSN|nr:uncharacterized protein TSTA_007500 [Talaromyces stipitatus ATCC 10500]EED11460.1 hypothetical protein TSTA_007500 [Talaromyces stipitatus ATCC 10500]
MDKVLSFQPRTSKPKHFSYKTTLQNKMYIFSAITALLLSASPAIVSGASIPDPLERRDYCGTLTTFAESDAVALANSLQNAENANGEMKYVPAHSYQEWDWGSARLCVWNDYIAENTHVSLWEAGWAAGYINNKCCKGSECTGGEATAHGDSGLRLRVVLKGTSESCM